MHLLRIAIVTNKSLTRPHSWSKLQDCTDFVHVRKLMSERWFVQSKRVGEDEEDW